MARTPPWGFDLSPAGRAVAAHGLVTCVSMPASPLGDEPWRALFDECGRHRLQGLLVAAVAAGALPVTAEQEERVAQVEIDLTAARIVHDGLLADVADHLGRIGVECCVLKGPALAHLDYPDPQWRPTGDIDLLVRPQDLDRAAEALVARGGRRTDPDPVPGYAATVGKGATVSLDEGIEADLHRLLVWGPFGVRLDPSLLWSAVRSFHLAQGTTLVGLPAEEALVHACCHLMVLGWRRALSARDVAQLLPLVEVERTLLVARSMGVEAVLAAAVRLAERELGLLDVGGLEAWAAGYAPRLRDRMWLRVERPEHPIGPLEPLATAIELPGGDARRLFIRATVRPAAGTISTPVERLRRVVRRLLPTR